MSHSVWSAWIEIHLCNPGWHEQNGRTPFGVRG